MDRLTHFEPVFYLLLLSFVVPFMLGYDWLVYAEPVSLEKSLTTLFLLTFLPITLAAGLYVFQTRQLRLTRIITSYNLDAIREIVVDAARLNNWEVKNNRKTLMILKTHPSFWSGSWGEQITLLFDERTVWVNSICDPDKRTSIVSAGRNKQNIEILTHALSS